MENGPLKKMSQKLTFFMEQGQGNQCQTPDLKFKEYIGINRKNGINLEETGKKQ